MCLLNAGRRLDRRRLFRVLVLGNLHLFVQNAGFCKALGSPQVLRLVFDCEILRRLLFLVTRGTLLNDSVDDSVFVDAAATLLLPLGGWASRSRSLCPVARSVR